MRRLRKLLLVLLFPCFLLLPVYSEDMPSIAEDSWEFAFKLLSDIEVQNLKLDNRVKELESAYQTLETAYASKEVALENSEKSCSAYKKITIGLATSTAGLTILSTVLIVALVRRK